MPFYDTTVCLSCHGNPPASGQHSKHVNGENLDCSVCHYGYGTNSLGHWYPDSNPPADVVFDTSVTGTLISYDGSNCNGDCHGKNHSDSW